MKMNELVGNHSHFEDFKKHLKYDSAERCIESMVKKNKKGKVLSQFLKALDTCPKDICVKPLVKKLAEAAVKKTQNDSKLTKARKTLEKIQKHKSYLIPQPKASLRIPLFNRRIVLF